MNELALPVVILSASQDDAERVNKSLRDAGHPARCTWHADFDELGNAIDALQPHLIVFFRDSMPVSTAQVAKMRRQHSCTAPLIVVSETADENAICEALRDGANDLVSSGQRERFQAVAARELRSRRLEQALDATLVSANRYKTQLKSLMAGSMDAMAEVQEGIVVEANQAWADLLGLESPDTAFGPLMDFIDEDSQAALKGALLACSKGKWDGTKLKIGTACGEAGTGSIELTLETSHYDGEPSVKLMVQRSAGPTLIDVPEAGTSATSIDGSTGLMNRAAFVQVLTDRLDERSQSGARALALIRIDKFRELQDDVGSIASEEIVIQLALLLKGLIGEQDVCGRFGGTVFGAIVERGTLRDIQAWGDHVVGRIAETIIDAGGKSITVTCTMGIAEIGQDTDRVEALISNAEQASRDGRADGGDRVVLQETSDENTRIRRIDSLWMYQIKSALVENRFRLVHLGIASLGGGTEKMLDTVLRMVDQQGDEVAATQFMESARRNSLARAIDRWVVGASVNYCAAHECDALFVKLSRDSLIDEEVVQWIAEQCAQKRVDPSRLVIQVAEADAMQFLKQVQTLSEQLHAARFRFAIEHFGLGRDPLRLLQQTPLDFVKIDGSLMQSVAANPELQDRVIGYISAAQRHGVETIAERVDDANTMAVLFQLGIGYMQGHYVHEPEVVLEASA